MAAQLPTDIEEPPQPCDRCRQIITLDRPICKITLHSYPTPAPDQTIIVCSDCAMIIWRHCGP